MDVDRERAGHGPADLRGWRGVLLTVRFLTELALLAVLAVAGAGLDGGRVAVGLAVLLPLLAVLIWGLLVAPKARRRLPDPRRLALELALFVASAAALAAAGHLVVAVGFAAVAGGAAVLVRVFAAGS